MAASLKFLSWNVRGLNIPQKRMNTWETLQRYKIDVAMLQETHLLEMDILKMQSNSYRVVAFSSFSKKARGVLILVKGSLNITDLGSGRDNQGRIAYIKSVINGAKIAFVSVYAPNDFDSVFYDDLTDIVLGLSEYTLIIGGDFNAVLEHSLDRTGTKESRDQSLSTNALRRWVSDCFLVDAWRIAHPTLKTLPIFPLDTTLSPELITFFWRLPYLRKRLIWTFYQCLFQIIRL